MIPLTEIAKRCSRKLRNWSLGDPNFADPRYFPEKLCLRNFHEFELYEDGSRVCYVDGGNAEILNSPSLVIHLTRLSYCIYENNHLIRDFDIPLISDFITVAYAEKRGQNISYLVEMYPMKQGIGFLLPEKNDLVFDSFDRTLIEGGRRAALTRAASASRVFAEWKLAEEMCRTELRVGDVVVRDGSLQTQITGESKYANQAYSEALRKKVIFTGLAKTSTLYTNTGMPLFSAISLMAKRNVLDTKRWFYYPIVDIRAPDHKAVMLAVKLHPSSKHVFRYEVLNTQAVDIDLRELVSKIANGAKDLTFPGYPYGLIEADRLARVREEEIEPLKIQFLSALSENDAWDELEAFIHVVDAHKVIDEI